MSAVDQPLKKRKLLDSIPQTQSPAKQPPPAPFISPPSQTRLVSPSSKAGLVSPPPQQPSQEEYLRKRRNKDEIRSLYECYKRIRFCLSRKDARLMPEFEQAYLSLITASRGCSSVQRIVVELIPKYAASCPTALEAAAKVAINMHNWSLSTVARGEDFDGVAYQTAKACSFGLVDICFIASSEAPASSVIRGICSAVFIDVLTFFISSLEGKNIISLGGTHVNKLIGTNELFLELKEENEYGSSDPLSRLLKFRALSLMRIFFCCPKSLLAACFELFGSSTGDSGIERNVDYFLKQMESPLNANSNNTTPSESIGMSIAAGSGLDKHEEVDKSQLSDGKANVKQLKPHQSLMEMVLNRDPKLRNWLSVECKKLDVTLCSRGASLPPAFKELYDSVSDMIVNADFVEDKIDDSSGSGKLMHTFSGNSEKVADLSTDPSKTVDATMSIDACEYKGKGDIVRTPALMNDNVDWKNEAPATEINMPPVEDASDAQNSGSMHQHLMSTSSQFSWHSDGDPSAFDVFPATRLLLLSSFSDDTVGSSVKLQFEDFGPVRNFLFFPAKKFALVEYQNIMDAVKAREYMHGSSPWGRYLNVRFLDIGLGCRGIINGAVVGDSRYLYVGKVQSPQDKDEILLELASGGTRTPRAVTSLTSENALLLEYASVDDAAIALSHIRQKRGKFSYDTFMKDNPAVDPIRKDIMNSSCRILVRHLDHSVPDDELLNAFSQYGEVSGWEFKRQSGCCLMYYHSYEAAERVKFHMDGVKFGQMAVRVEIMTESPKNFGSTKSSGYPTAPIRHSENQINTSIPIGSRRLSSLEASSHSSFDSKLSLHYSTPFNEKHECINELVSPRLKVGTSSIHIPNEQANWTLDSGTDVMDSVHMKEGYAVSHANESFWQYKKPAMEPQLFSSTSQQSALPVTSVNSVIPPPVQVSSFANPAYGTPTNPWENITTSFPLNQTSCIIGGNNHTHPCPLPYIPSSITPLAQLSGRSLQFEQSVGAPPLSPPPPDVPPPSPPPPPLPPSMPPSVPPPPPNSPPLTQPVEQSDFKIVETCSNNQWQGTLCKSGVQYCTVYVLRLESSTCRYSVSLSEPADWPTKLDVTKRTDFKHVRTTFMNTPSYKREVCRLLPSTGMDTKGFRDFISYLKQRECAGVIKISAGKCPWSRLLFILPQTPEFCSLFCIAHHSSESLIALVLAKDASS